MSKHRSIPVACHRGADTATHRRLVGHHHDPPLRRQLLRFAQLFPPLSPAASADEIAAFFVEHKLWIRFGVSGALLSAALALPFLAAIVPAHPPRRRRVGHAVDDPADGRDRLRAGADLPAVLPRVAAYRPAERSAELTQASTTCSGCGSSASSAPSSCRTSRWRSPRSSTRPTRRRSPLVRLPQPLGRDALTSGLRGGRLQRRPAGLERCVRVLHPRPGARRVAVRHHRGDAGSIKAEQALRRRA